MIRTFKKTFWNQKEWEIMNFYEMKQEIQTVEWAKSHYGNTHYSKTWWVTHNNIVMNEKIYIHWKLCE